ncbi:contact-dependent growth inhibition system immunity protein [Erythrobacter sp.]|jgi:hypothetical protein|uniref:contact-dependent growth inhibition system immunity protein n=1 Tax=Erythrobacter sp. TaxID=1042 RepID=UPI002EA18F34|nr:contact-dependent growth inhibition system immunity protein [Erythrobacter sp.]
MGMTQKLRKEAEDRWPNLKAFLQGYMHEDWPVDDGTPENPVDRAVAETPLSALKSVASEWWQWNSSAGSAHDPRRQIHDGLSVNVHFKTSLEARQFMNLVYDKLIVAIRKDEKGWKP